ncbi:bone morphogenic protein 1 [Apostichopus japonicus]|uniref:Bone morphogenic protein 1 n=1 Tax=Stichopus japonicus TaxID=307972 RepID=A0A2G8K789_STIJA|nr:bone morphogenic protein 1 [Apostichopus japonicus]
MPGSLPFSLPRNTPGSLPLGLPRNSPVRYHSVSPGIPRFLTIQFPRNTPGSLPLGLPRNSPVRYHSVFPGIPWFFTIQSPQQCPVRYHSVSPANPWFVTIQSPQEFPGLLPFSLPRNSPVRYHSVSPGIPRFLTIQSPQEFPSKCQKEITDVSGVITSPNFPDNYPKRKQCSWHIIATPGHRVELDFDEFDLEAHQECAYDHVRIYDGDSDERLGLGTFCGHHLPDDILSSGNHMFISFYSDASVSRPGFSARHRTVCGGTLMATHGQLSLYSHAELSDGNYPSQADCLWTIIAPQGWTIRFWFVLFDIELETECGYDYVEIEEGFETLGKYCGERLPPDIVTNGDELTIHFVSDDTIHRKGFHAKYQLDDEIVYDLPNE